MSPTNRYNAPETPNVLPRIHLEVDEEYIPDERYDIRPSQVVQSKLMNVLPKGMAIPVSCHHGHRLVRR
jgi:hypothetical protein